MIARFFTISLLYYSLLNSLLLKDISLRKRIRISRHGEQSYNFLPDERARIVRATTRVLLNYTCIMSYVAGPPRDTILRKALPDGDHDPLSRPLSYTCHRTRRQSIRR